MPNPWFDFETRIADRRVVVNTGSRTQTVNICTSGDKPGPYEAKYRLPIDALLLDADDLPPLEDLVSLGDWLTMRGATPEIVGKASPLKPLVQLIKAPERNDPWVQKAIVAVEQAITDMVDEFVDHPYLYRVEHSLHTRLYALLIQRPAFADRVRIGKTGWMTQLVHKEWPETYPQLNSKGEGRRGLFDFGILSPQQLERATLTDFRQGRIEAPIVIEVGLDYGFGHLEQDYVKLQLSHVTAPYLLHLSRVPVSDEDRTQKFLCDREAPFRTAYVHHTEGGKHSVKQISDDHVSLSGG